MKKIGEGWQYTTYDLGNGRVLKKFHSLPKIYWVILKDIFPFHDDPLYKLPGFARASKRKAKASFEILKKKSIPPASIGNPKFLENLDYEQDKARPLHNVFEKSDTATIKSIVDQFIILNQIIRRAWDKHYVAGCIKNEEAREYFIKKMDENFGLKS